MRVSRSAILGGDETFWSRCSALLLSALVLVGANVRGAAQSLQPLPGIANAVHSEVTTGTAALLFPLSQDKVLNFGILLRPSNEAALTDFRHHLGDPSHPSFRRFLTPEEFEQQYGPSANDYQAVLTFAGKSGFKIIKTYKGHLLIDLSGTVSQIESAFHIKMNMYQHPNEPRAFFSPDREPTASLPFAVQSIAGLDDFATAVPAVKKRPLDAPAPAGGSGPGSLYLPSDMRAAYYGGTSLTGTGQIVGLLQYENFNVTDVTMDLGNGATYTTIGTDYYQIHYPAQGASFQPIVYTELIDGAHAAPSSSDPNGVAEAGLDVAQAIGMAPGVSEVIQYIGLSASNDYDLFAQMANENSAKQIGVSWTWNPSSVSRLDGIFAQMAVQGQNIFAATGDYGSWPYSGGYYFPAEDANITAVGGTNLTTTGAGGAYLAESGWSGSSGGFSPDGYPIPSYQSSLNGINGASTVYRNAPDVAMEASDDYACSFGSCGGYVGTSFATPRWAGFLALANQQASQAGNTSIGFINPTLYSIGASGSYASTFHDVTTGSNGSFSAGSNYDLVTGFGSPNGQAMLTALQVGAAPRPYSASVSLPQDNVCASGGSFSFSVAQSNNANSLTWTTTVSVNMFLINQVDWDVQDSSGVFLSGSLNSGSQTGTGSTVVAANRAPSGVPTLYVNGSVIGEYSGCYDSFSTSAVAIH